MAEIIDPPLSAVVQTQDTAVQVYSDVGQSRWTTTYKGPFDKLNTIYGELPTLANDGTTPDEFDTVVRSTGITVDRKYNYPTSVVDVKGDLHEWYLDNLRLSELDGGQGQLVAEFSLDGNPFGSASTGQPDSADWSVSWETYTLSPYAFCAQDEHNDEPSYAERTKNQKSNRQHIKLAFSATNQANPQGQTFGSYTVGQYDQSQLLNENEMAILNKVCQDKRAQYHYPVVTLNENWGNLSAMKDPKDQGNFNVGDDVDYILSALPKDATGHGCPFEFKLGWQWIQTDDSISFQTIKGKLGKKTYNTTRSRSWMGAISADINFYGRENEGQLSGRWTVGGM